MDFPGRLPGAGLPLLIHTSQLLADRFDLVAKSLNTAPVTLAAVAKECRAVTDALRRFKYLRDTIPETIVFDPILLDDSCHDALNSISENLSTLNVYSTRIRPATSDSAVDMSSGQITIIWNEAYLKQMIRQTKISRQSLAFLLNCVPSEHITSKNHSTFIHSSRSVPWHCAMSPAVLNKGSRLRLSSIGARPRPRPDVCPVSELSGIRSALKRLKPPPGTIYRQSAQTIKDLHDAIDREDESAVVKLLLQRIDPNVPRPGSKLSPLRRALDRQVPSLVTFLAMAGADLEDRNDEGETILITAVKYGYSDKIIALLCDLGANANAVDNLGCSAVHHAAMSANEDDTLAVLVHAGADVNRGDFGTRTPLIAAVQNYRFKPIEKLIEYGADLETRMQNGQTALHVAISMKSRPMTEFLSDQGAYLDRRANGHTALTYAIATGCSDIAEVLIEAGADVNLPGSRGNFPLQAAAAAGDQRNTKLLLSRGAKCEAVGSDGFLPVHVAAHENRVEVLRLLLKAGSPIDPITDRGETPLTLATHLGCFEAAQFLIEAGADVNYGVPGADTIICQALTFGHTRIAIALVQRGADMTYRLLRNASMTPLHLAAHYGQNDVLAAMINAGADLETRTWPGFTPLFPAVRAGHLSTVRLLVTAGAFPRARSNSGANLLFFGTAEPAMIKLLIELGLDIHERDHHGATPLHYAALHGHTATVKLLLQRGARLVHASAVFETLHDYKQKASYRQGTPAGLARQNGHVNIARLIEGWKFKS
ncbi:hypothetical protein CSUB01_10046 [Colletotrichum sublineola]|uniref:Uncharacterized protein n=1 Tax=Colletotrichum sublineola TaxID=1173701 RepID=A0A066XTP8_COLSU|nr:hypothetical protein CSUB01_10046 [Colletotrichum sublineola]